MNGALLFTGNSDVIKKQLRFHLTAFLVNIFRYNAKHAKENEENKHNGSKAQSQTKSATA